MDNLEISQVEKKQLGTGATGFHLFDEDHSYSSIEGDDGAYDQIEADYIDKLRTQRERVNY